MSNRRLSSRTLIWLETGLWMSAALLLVWCAHGWADAAMFQSRHAGSFDVPAAEATAPTEEAIEPGSPIADLSIPRLDVDVVVAEGTSPETLARAAGRISGSALPGTGGNVAIAAHRDSFFRPLRAIETGDLVVLRAANGARRYRVEWTRIVEPGDVDVVAPTDYAALTLVTCYPFYYVGDAPRRFVVRARAVDSDAPA